MRKCYACQQMKAVVLVAKKPDGKRGYICSDCHVDSASDWYYWSKNKYAHFIVFRLQENQVATATIKPLSDDECREEWLAYGSHRWTVTGPCWSTFLKTDVAKTFEEAQKIADEYITKIIEEEFEPEPIHPLG